MNYAALLLVSLLVLTSCNAGKESLQEGETGTVSIVNEKSDANEITEFDLQEYLEKFDEKLSFIFSVEGNITGSGSLDILAFYEWKSSMYIEGQRKYNIGTAYCFTYDIKNNLVDNYYEVSGYGTMSFDEINNIDEMPMEELGREVLCWDRKIGVIGDFNQNGREELYFYQLNGFAFIPMFYEFRENQFYDIINYPIRSTFFALDSVDHENKTLNFLGGGGEKLEKVSYVWNDSLNGYRIASEEFLPYALPQ